MHPTTLRRPGVRLAGALVLAYAATACGGGSAPPSPDVWAVVDGREISREDVEAAYRRMAQQPAPPPADELADVDQAFNERKSNMSDDAFQKELDRRQVSADAMKQALKRELIVQKLLEQEIGGKVTPDDQEVREFYDANRERFNVAETQYRIAQLVVTPVREPQVRNRRQDDAASVPEAQKKVAMLAERLKAGAGFAELAMDYSEDPESAPQGGDLGFITTSRLNQVPPELRDLVLRTAPGRVGAVSAGGGHTFVYVIAREEAGQRDLSHPAVKDAITSGIRERREQTLRAAYIAAARNEITVVNHLARMIVETGGRPPALGVTAPAP